MYKALSMKQRKYGQHLSNLFLICQGMVKLNDTFLAFLIKGSLLELLYSSSMIGSATLLIESFLGLGGGKSSPILF